MTPAPLTHAEIEELLGAYTLDAVDADEREAIEIHLAGCPRCRAEVDAGREVAAGLAQTGSAAPEGVWDRIASAIEGEPAPPLRLVAAPPASSAPRLEPRRAAWRRTFLAVAAVAAALVVVALTTRAIDGDGRSSDLAEVASAAFDDDAAQLGMLRDGDGDVLATAAVLPDGSGYLRLEDMPAIDDGVYQLWGVTADEVVSLGVFGDEQEVIAFNADEATTTLMVTHEDAPVERSERSPVVVGELA